MLEVNPNYATEQQLIFSSLYIKLTLRLSAAGQSQPASPPLLEASDVTIKLLMLLHE